MKTGIYKIADTVIEIRSLYSEVQELCRDYQTVGCTPEFVIETNQADIDFEREKGRDEAELEGVFPVSYPDSRLETLAVYRRLAVKLLKKNILLFHGSLIAVDGVGYLFTAKSGTGKSTHTRLWREKFGSRAIMVNDDKPLLQISEHSVTAYGTPWAGKHRLNTNIQVPLKAVCELVRGTKNYIEPITECQAIPILYQQTYKPSGEADLLHTLQLVGQLEQNVGIYRLVCNMEPEAVDVAWKGMNDGGANASKNHL